MSLIPNNVRQNLITVVPASIIDEISCFVFYDDHPRDNKNIDVTICTIHGEVKEYFRRELVYFTLIDHCAKPSDIRILRNSRCELFYLVAFGDEIIVLSRTETLEILHRINNVDSYEVEDSVCRGQACLKIICKDDAVPLIFDENFESLGERAEILNETSVIDSLPIVVQLSRKLTEAKYSVKCNEKAYKDLLSLRQIASLNSGYKPSDSTADNFGNQHGPTNAMRIKTIHPYITLRSNRKIMIMLDIINSNDYPAEDLHCLLHESTETSLSYTTRLFESIPTPPFWKEICTNKISSNRITRVVMVIDFKELNYSVTKRLDLKGEIVSKSHGQENYVPFGPISLSALEIMGEEDLVSLEKMHPHNSNIVALLAATEKIDLNLRHIKKENEPDLNLLDLICKYLKMQRMQLDKMECTNIVHINSPYHILHGIMVFEKENIGNNNWIISLHTRMPSQILAFLHYVHDAIPYRIIVTTIDQKITSKVPELSAFNENTYPTAKSLNYKEFAMSIVQQAAVTLDYLDACMIKMNESKDIAVRNKIGSEIDIFAGDKSSFLEYRKIILEKAAGGIRSVSKDESPASDSQAQGMVIDID